MGGIGQSGRLRPLNCGLELLSCHADDSKQPMPLRQRHWGPLDAVLAGSPGSTVSMSRAGSRALPDAEAGEAGEQSFSGSPTAEPLNKSSSSHKFFQSTTTAVRQAFQVRRMCKGGPNLAYTSLWAVMLDPGLFIAPQCVLVPESTGGTATRIATPCIQRLAFASCTAMT